MSFYGYKYFAEENYDVNFIEFIPELNKKYLLIDKVLRKISNLPFYFNNIMTKITIKVAFVRFSCFTNERMLISSLIYLTIIKEKRTQISCHNNGLFSKNTKINKNFFKNYL